MTRIIKSWFKMQLPYTRITVPLKIKLLIADILSTTETTDREAN
jgi:hypothetical protein